MYEYETEPTEAETAELETVTAWLASPVHRGAPIASLLALAQIDDERRGRVRAHVASAKRARAYAEAAPTSYWTQVAQHWTTLAHRAFASRNTCDCGRPIEHLAADEEGPDWPCLVPDSGSAGVALLLCAPGLVLALVFTVRILAALAGVAGGLS